MARTHKIGIDYFSHDVDMCQDQKVRILMAKYGLDGYGVFNRLLEDLYRDKGYYLEINEDFNILFSNDNNLEIDVYINILNDCINRGLFNKKIYENYKVLTSKRIQMNYIEATKRRSRVDFLKEYLLVNEEHIDEMYSKRVNVNINTINDDINSLNDDNGTQRKVKEIESKEKESKKKEEEINILDSFEYLWDLYPNKKGKGSITKSKKKLNFIHDNKDELERCIKRYIKYVKNERKNGFKSLRYMNGSTFFNSGHVDYLDKNYRGEEVDSGTNKQDTPKSMSIEELAAYRGKTVEQIRKEIEEDQESDVDPFKDCEY